MKNKHKLTKQTGFTLLELLVVMVILGILVTIGLGNFANSRTKAYDSQRKTDLKHIAQVLELFYNDKGYYPPDNDGGLMQAVDNLDPVNITEFDWGDPFYDPVNSNTVYMTHLPTDPHAYNYYYEAENEDVANGGPQYYALYAYLENNKDPDRADPAYSNTNCGQNDSIDCNFRVSSSNYQD